MQERECEYIEFICLADSRKMGGHCVAGIGLDGEGWVRFVGTGEYGELAANDCSFENDERVSLLDVVQVPVLSHAPLDHQPENFTIDDSFWWIKLREAEEADISLIKERLQTDELLFGNSGTRMSQLELAETPATSSLTLVEPRDVSFQVVTKRQRNCLQARVRFHLGKTAYDLPLTDLEWERKLKGLGEGSYDRRTLGIQPTDTVWLTISLGDPFEGYCYKLAAGMVVLHQPKTASALATNSPAVTPKPVQSIEPPSPQVDLARRLFPRAHEPWSDTEEATLEYLLQLGHDDETVAAILLRQVGAIRSRKSKLDLDG